MSPPPGSSVACRCRHGPRCWRCHPPRRRAARSSSGGDKHLLVPDTTVQLIKGQQVNNASALGQVGQIAMHCIAQYQRPSLHKVQILPGGEVIDHTATAQVRLLQREAGLKQGVYSGVITAGLMQPDVRVGDTLHLQYSVAGANPIFGGRHVQSTSWQRPVPCSCVG